MARPKILHPERDQVGDQVTVSKGIQKIPSKHKRYRARKMIQGKTYELKTNNLRDAQKWIRDMDAKANKLNKRK